MQTRFPKPILLFSLGWFALNLMQSLFTNVIGDEAYYYYYSTELSWGYFDHPPMVAWIIWLSDLIFSGNLSIRFVTNVLSSITILLIWLLIPKNNRQQNKSAFIYILLVLASRLFHGYAFVTTPDAPLLFFGCLYLLAFRRFLEKPDLSSTMLTGLTAALLIYSKYHGGLLILAAVFLNFGVLKNYRIYLAGAIAGVLLIPHFLWLIQHDFIPLAYHLVHRMNNDYTLVSMLSSVAGCIGAINPILLVLAVIFSMQPKPDTSNTSPHLVHFKRLFWSLYVFFILYSFRSKVEAHWVAMTMIPLIPILHDSLLNAFLKFQKNIKTILIVMVVGLFAGRIILMLPINIKSDFHEYGKGYFLDIKKLAGNRKVAFVNKYTQASLYHFYTGEPAFAYADAHYRKSQYDLAEHYKNVYWDSAVVVGNWAAPRFTTYKSESGQKIHLLYLKDFKSLGMLRGTVELPPTIRENEPVSVTMELFDPNKDKKLLTDNPGIHVQLLLRTNTKRYIFPVKVDEVTSGKSEEYRTMKLTFTVSDVPAGVWDAQIAVKHHILNPQSLTEESKVEVVELSDN